MPTLHSAKRDFLPLLFSLTMAALGFACADHGGCPSAWPQGYYQSLVVDGDEDQQAEQEAQEAATTTEELSGAWAMNFSIAYSTILPVVNQKVQMLLVGIAKTPAKVEGKSFIFTEQICDFSMNVIEDIDFEIIFPQQSVDAIPQKERLAIIDGLEAGSAFTAETILDLYGADETLFDDPADDTLPIDKNDDKVVDFENDGHVGVTARLNGFVQGEVYVLFRMKRTLDGEFDGIDTMEGHIESSVEMITLDASWELLIWQLDLERVENDALHHFEMVKLPRDMSCAELRDKAGDLFDYDPLEFAVPLDD